MYEFEGGNVEKKEFIDLFKELMKSRGFKIRGKCGYKFIDEEYLVGVWLDYNTYADAYYIEYGVIYEPEEEDLKKPFSSYPDFSMRFQFTTNPEDSLLNYDIGNIDLFFNRTQVIDWFEYSCRTKEDFEKQLEINIEKRFNLLYDKDYVKNIFRNNWLVFRALPKERVIKLSKIFDLNPEEVLNIIRSDVRKWP